MFSYSTVVITSTQAIHHLLLVAITSYCLVVSHGMLISLVQTSCEDFEVCGIKTSVPQLIIHPFDLKLSFEAEENDLYSALRSVQFCLFHFRVTGYCSRIFEIFFTSILWKPFVPVCDVPGCISLLLPGSSE